MAVRIISIKKEKGDHENPYLAVDYLEWINERILVCGATDRSKIYDWIKESDGEAYILNKHGKKIYLIPAVSAKGDKYVKTVNNELDMDGLLLLLECI